MNCYSILFVSQTVYRSQFYRGLNARHLITRQKQSQYAHIKHLSALHALYAVAAAINLRSVLKNSNRKYELIFGICNAAAGLVLFALALLRPRHPELRDGEVSHDTTASQWSLLSFSWMTLLIKLGNARELSEADLWDLPRKCEAVRCYQERIPESPSRYNSCRPAIQQRLAWHALDGTWRRFLQQVGERKERGVKEFFTEKPVRMLEEFLSDSNDTPIQVSTWRWEH